MSSSSNSSVGKPVLRASDSPGDMPGWTGNLMQRARDNAVAQVHVHI